MDKKITESMMLARFEVGAELLRPLVIRSRAAGDEGRGGQADARIEVGLPGKDDSFRFVVECKSRATPESIQQAIANAKAAAQEGERPMIQVPFLSAKSLEKLEAEGVSGVDLCGNGVVIVPWRLLVIRSGQPNKYPDSRPVINPYRGRSALVARLFLMHRQFNSLNDLWDGIRKAGGEMSLSQTSKAVAALAEDLIISKSKGILTLRDPVLLLDKLGRGWKKPLIQSRLNVRIPEGTNWVAALSANPDMKWAVTGESSVSHYATFSQGGPQRIAVSALEGSLAALGGVPEPIPNYADVELLETEEPGFFFNTEIDEKGIRWASRLQTWLELQAGDGRQREAARDLRSQIISGGGR
jgi:hypothetical protein